MKKNQENANSKRKNPVHNDSYEREIFFRRFFIDPIEIYRDYSDQEDQDTREYPYISCDRARKSKSTRSGVSIIVVITSSKNRLAEYLIDERHTHHHQGKREEEIDPLLGFFAGFNPLKKGNKTCKHKKEISDTVYL